MNEKDLYNYFYKYMPKAERKEFCETLKNFDTAVRLNPDEDFFNEATEHICKKYPFLKIAIKEAINRKT